MDNPAVFAKVSRRRNECGEWLVRFYDADGKLCPNSTYYTPDKDDAIATAEHHNAIQRAVDDAIGETRANTHY